MARAFYRITAITVQYSVANSSILFPSVRHAQHAPVQWEADADHEEPASYTWSILKPADWTQEVPGGWRYAPGELARMAAARNDAHKRACHE